VRSRLPVALLSEPCVSGSQADRPVDSIETVDVRPQTVAEHLDAGPREIDCCRSLPGRVLHSCSPSLRLRSTSGTTLTPDRVRMRTGKSDLRVAATRPVQLFAPVPALSIPGSLAYHLPLTPNEIRFFRLTASGFQSLSVGSGFGSKLCARRLAGLCFVGSP
jgi:hypothetical protein